MERLTKYAIPALGRGIPKKYPCFSNSIVKNGCPLLFCHKVEKCDSIKNRKCPYLQVMDKLAAYEDTGLEPEEIKEWIEAGKELFFERSDFFAELGPIGHLRELAQAEKDGRLVVLPECVPGDPPPKKREMRTEGATSYCPKNCPNKDCVGGQCLVNHGTKPRRR